MRRLLIVAALVAVGLAVQPAMAMAEWLSPGTGSGSSTATRVNSPVAPTVVRSGSNVVVSWPQGKLANGTVVTGYQVKRTVGTTTTTLCTTTEPTRTCTDGNPAGTASYAVVNRYANWSATGPTTSLTFDQTAPATTLTSNPAPNAAGWNKTDPTLTLTATDAGGSGVASITYKIGSGSAVTVNGASASFPVTTTGVTTVTYFATDVAGNVEATKTSTVRLDKTSPTLTNVFPANNGSYTNQQYRIGCTPQRSVCGNANDNQQVVTVQIKLMNSSGQCLGSGGGFTTANCSAYLTATGTTTWYSTTGNLAKSTYTLTVLVTDVAGNTNGPAGQTFAFTRS
ncbi:MAG TPA: hypothetical protein VH419_01735 [Nocardioidaceae bacterium]|jgi:hypothetical protein